MRIMVIVINYANEEEVLQFTKSLSRQSISNEIGLIVVNNKSSIKPRIDLSAELKKVDLNINLFKPGENLGYLSGSFYGYNQFMQLYPEVKVEWAVVSNTDITINDIRFFEKIDTNKYDSDIWCVAPSVFSPNTQSYQNPHYINRISKFKISSVIFINSFAPLAFIYLNLSKGKSKCKKSSKKGSMFVYSPHGCFFALRREFIEIVGKYSYGGFLYSEESYIAENLILNHKKCYYDSDIEVIHTENSVTCYLGTKKRADYIKNSLIYIRDKFY